MNNKHNSDSTDNLSTWYVSGLYESKFDKNEVQAIYRRMEELNFLRACQGPNDLLEKMEFLRERTHYRKTDHSGKRRYILININMASRTVIYRSNENQERLNQILGELNDVKSAPLDTFTFQEQVDEAD